MKYSFDEIQNKYVDIVKYYMSLGYEIDVAKSMKTHKTIFNIENRNFKLYLLFNSSYIEGSDYPVQIVSIILEGFNKHDTYDVIQRYYLISEQLYSTEVNDVFKYREKIHREATLK